MMFKDKYIHKLYAFALAAVFALVLAGCGGGGGGTTDTTDPMPTDPPPPTEAQKLATAKTAAMTAYEAAKAALAAVMDDASHDMDSYDMAQEALNEAKAANAVAQAATTSAAAEDAQAIVETARDNVVMYAGMVTAAATKAAERVVQEAANKVAGTKEMAISTEAAQTADAGLGGSDAPASGSAGAYGMTIKRDRSGTTVEIALEQAADDDPKFMQAMDLGGGRTMHARAMEADSDGNVVEEVVIVSTDIEAPEAVAFAKFEEDLAGTTSQALAVRKDGVTVDADNPADSFDVSAAISTVATRVSNIMAAGFSSSGAGTLTYPADNSATDDKDEAFETAGTYNGAMGTYRCAASSGATCSVTYDAKGKISSIATNWIFTPAEGAMSDQPDYDYYNYGFWLKKTTDKDGVLTYNEVETFAGSTLAPATGSPAGTASYAGGATGVYVKNTYNPDRTLDTASSGHFTADVNLMAYFGGGNVGTNKHHSIEGTIDNFMLSGEGDDGSGWSVDVAAGPGISGGAFTDGTAKGGGGATDAEKNGSFTGTYHGPVVDAEGGIHGPKVLVGEFNATFTDGSVAGGYGARKQDN